MGVLKIIWAFSLFASCVTMTGCFPYHATTRMGLSGTVIDADTRSPLPDARISFLGATNEILAATSVPDGSFTVPRLR
jgi:hypothetical protein